ILLPRRRIQARILAAISDVFAAYFLRSFFNVQLDIARASMSEYPDRANLMLNPMRQLFLSEDQFRLRKYEDFVASLGRIQCVRSAELATDGRNGAFGSRCPSCRYGAKSIFNFACKVFATSCPLV